MRETSALAQRITALGGSATHYVGEASAVVDHGALKGDRSSLITLMRIAEQTGKFADDAKSEQLIIRWVE